MTPLLCRAITSPAVTTPTNIPLVSFFLSDGMFHVVPTSVRLFLCYLVRQHHQSSVVSVHLAPSLCVVSLVTVLQQRPPSDLSPSTLPPLLFTPSINHPPPTVPLSPQIDPLPSPPPNPSRGPLPLPYPSIGPRVLSMMATVPYPSLSMPPLFHGRICSSLRERESLIVDPLDESQPSSLSIPPRMFTGVRYFPSQDLSLLIS